LLENLSEEAKVHTNNLTKMTFINISRLAVINKKKSGVKDSKELT
jgi:hypothetical protein